MEPALNLERLSKYCRLSRRFDGGSYDIWNNRLVPRADVIKLATTGQLTYIGTRVQPFPHQLLSYQGWPIIMLVSMAELRVLLPKLELDGTDLVVLDQGQEIVMTRPQPVEWEPMVV